ncbi:MAG: response regulator, partial [Syntrophobacteria bacterium]
IIPEIWMRESILVVDADEEQCHNLCAMLEREHFSTTALHSLLTLDKEMQEAGPRVVILDLDTLPVDNRLFRTLKKTNPGVCVIGLSSRPFHPELEEAMSTYIHACLGKPIDEEELVFWLKSSCEDS